MNIRPTVSKSSMENFELCPMQYWYTYNLGYRSEGGLKTVIGSAVHGVMEALMMMKLDMQGAKTGKIQHEEMGEITYSEAEYWEVRILTDLEVDAVNKSRVNKSTYIDQKKLVYGSTRVGEKVVERLIEIAKNAYLSKFDMKSTDVRDYTNYVWMTLEGFDPRPYTVVAIEYPFDLPLPYEWAKIPGSEDYVRIKGFIDLILDIGGDYYIYDYKTGQRKCFLTGEKKTYSKIKTDIQLAIYTYILRLMFPDKNVVANLLFVRDGGLFSVCFDDSVADYVETEIKNHINAVLNTKVPRLLDPTRNDFRCKYLCGAAKNNNFSNVVCDCQFLSSKIREVGLEAAEKEYHKDRFTKFEV